MNLLFTFSDNTNLSSEFILDNAKVTTVFYNQLKSADNSASLRVPFNENLCDKLKAEINKNTRVQIVEGNTPLFTGYVRKNLAFQKTQRNQPFALEIVSPSLLLNVTYQGTVIHYTEPLLEDVIRALLSFTDFQGTIDTTKTKNEELKIFTLHDGENIHDVLNELLFEYGYCYDFDNAGNFYITDIFTTPQVEIPQKFNGDNCLKEIQQTVKEDSYNRINVVWNKMEYMSDVLIFEDTTGADANFDAKIEIAPHKYYLDTELNYLNYDSKYQSIAHINSARADIQYDDDSGIIETFSNLGSQGELSIFNESDFPRFITKLRVLGNGYFETSTNNTRVGSNGAELQIATKYIQEESHASNLARKVGDYYNYGNFSISVLSKTNYDLGSFVEVSDAGIGTIRARIIKKVWDIKTNTFSYALESISDYTPIETYITKQSINSSSDGGANLKETVSELGQRVDEIITDTVSVNADVLSAVINTDDLGMTVQPYTIATTINVRQNSQDVDFVVGAMNLPNGWTFERIRNQIIFHIAQDTQVRSGRFNIPIQYRQIIQRDSYVDENGNQYVDENMDSYEYQKLSSSYTQWNLSFFYYADNGGVYFGLVRDLSVLNLMHNFGDYFTWAGERTESDLCKDGFFATSGVYRYVGTENSYQWVRDESDEHMMTAMSDILLLKNEDLQRNNSKVWEYLDHLTANSIFTRLLVANEIIAESIKSYKGFFENITITGTGYLKDMVIDGNSIFKGEIMSGPVQILNDAPDGDTLIIPANTDIIAYNLEQYNKYDYEGTYKTYSFNGVKVTENYNYYPGGTAQVLAGYDPVTKKPIYQTVTIPSSYSWNIILILLQDGVEIYRESKINLTSRTFIINLELTIHYQVPPDSKTFKLINLPTVRPSEPNIVWNDGGTLRIS